VNEASRIELAAQLARLARTEAIQELLSSRLLEESATRDEKRLVLRAMAAAGLRPVPEKWISALNLVLASTDEVLLRESVTAARALPLDPKRSVKLVEKLLAVGSNPRFSAEVRLSALAAVPGGLMEVKPDTFAFLLAQMDRQRPVVERSLAADVISRSKLSTDQLIDLTRVFDKVSPMELDRLLEAFTHSTHEGVGLKLLAAIERSPVRAGLRVDGIRRRLSKYNSKVQKAAEGLY
jgi:hypothetical protein